MRARLGLVVALVAAVVLGACDDGGDGGGSVAAVAAPEDLCELLRPALAGDLDGLDDYATDDVLAELDGWYAEAEAAYDDGMCVYTAGDAWIEVALKQQGKGWIAVAAEAKVSGDSPGGAPDEAAVSDAVAAFIAGGSACEGQPIGNVAESHETHVIEGGVIVAIACDFFAYQGSYHLVGWDGSELFDLAVEQWIDNSLDYSPIVLGLPSVDEGMLVNVERYRGPGDCGLYQKWFAQETADGLTLGLSVAYEQSCDGAPGEADPERWPKVYPAAHGE